MTYNILLYKIIKAARRLSSYSSNKYSKFSPDGLE
jgi:hypothetical protein